MAMRRNIFATECLACGLRVEPEQGFIRGQVGKDWKVIHEQCIPVVRSPLPEGLEYDL